MRIGGPFLAYTPLTNLIQPKRQVLDTSYMIGNNGSDFFLVSWRKNKPRFTLILDMKELQAEVSEKGVSKRGGTEKPEQFIRNLDFSTTYLLFGTCISLAFFPQFSRR